MSRPFAITFSVLVSAMLLPACLTRYHNQPAVNIGAAAPSKAYPKLYYHVDDQIHDQAAVALAGALKTKSPFKSAEAIDAPPAQGVFVDVSIKTVPEGHTARVYKGISYATLTVIPYWTGRGGSDLLYEVYVDGRKMKNFDYQIRRKKVTWIGLLPFAWVNLMSHTEAEAFDATALQFFDDADPLFRTATTSAP